MVPGCGLCNRLQAIVCGQLYAADTGRDYYMNWSAGELCGAAFDELFTAPVEPRADIPANARIYSSIQRHPWIAEERYRSLLAGDVRQHFSGLRNDTSPTVAIFTCHQFLSYYHDDRFVPTLRKLFTHVHPDITRRVEVFRREHYTDRTIGVHIRRQDWPSQKGLDYYIEFMRRYPDATFFVCSDDAATLDEIRSHFKTVVTFPTSSQVRGDKDAIQDALAEVILLSKTSFLIGTPGSSFSAMARAVGGMPGNFDYGLSISMRDLRLGNLGNPARLLWRRLRRNT